MHRIGRIPQFQTVHSPPRFAGLKGLWTEKRINALITNVRSAMDSHLTEPAKAYDVIHNQLMHHHFVVKDAADLVPRWGELHSSCSADWCKSRAELDNGVPVSDLHTPSDRGITQVTTAQFEVIEVVIKAKFSMQVVQHLCHEYSTNPNENSHVAIAKHSGGKFYGISRSNSYFGKVAASMLAKSTPNVWRKAAFSLSTGVAGPALDSLITRKEQRRQYDAERQARLAAGRTSATRA